MLKTTETEDRYRRLYAEHHRAIYAYFRRRIDADSAQDCAAETFLVAWRRIDDAPGGGGDLRWLYMIARNVLRNAYRSKRRSRTLLGIEGDLVDDHGSPEDAVVRHEDEDAVIAALDGLRSRDREILLLAVWEELPRDDIAAIVGCSSHAVSQRLHRASERLARQLDRVTTTRYGRAIPRDLEGLP